MTLPLENPLSPSRGSFLSRAIRTRRRLKQLDGWAPKLTHAQPGMAAPKVSVMLITYNHERYVGQAIESILKQKCDFEIEINVIDDASTDRTQEIVREYKRKHPGIVNCYFNPVNAGHIATQLNTIRGFSTLRGEYFSLLEGDDYWMDDNKLAKQVMFLDANLEFVACAHQTLKVFDDDARSPEHFLPFKSFGRDTATLHDLITMSGVFHLSSIVYRNVFGLNPPPCLEDEYSCEVTINMLYGTFGKFFCLEEYSSAYRVHEHGVFSSRSYEKHWLFLLHGYRRFAIYLGPKYWRMFSRAVISFSGYVLSAPRRGDEVTSLAFRTKLVFWLHRLVALWAYAAIRAIGLFTDSQRRSRDRSFASHIAGVLKFACQAIYRTMPAPAISFLFSIECRFPRVQQWRRQLKAKLLGRIE